MIIELVRVTSHQRGLYSVLPKLSRLSRLEGGRRRELLCKQSETSHYCSLIVTLLPVYPPLCLVIILTLEILEIQAFPLISDLGTEEKNKPNALNYFVDLEILLRLG